MLYIYPSYYDRFTCIADKCIDTCCAQWQIVIDDETLEQYENYDGEYKTILCQRINWEEGVFWHNKKGTCAFLRDDQLCDMYINMGKDSLCKTCREYPRHTEEFENVREISLSLSCPEVSRILMNTTEKVTFLRKEDEEEEVFDEFDYFMYSNLEDIREELLRVIQNRELDMRQRIAKVLQIGGAAQRHYDAGTLVQWEALEEVDKVSVKDEYELMKQQLAYLSQELELLYTNWEKVLQETNSLLFEEGEAVFIERKEQFLSWWKNSELTPLEIVLEQILVYFISIYLLGAVYDENIVGKVDACVGHAVEIFMLFMARWWKRGESLEMDDVIELVYRYSREIEHSDENLEQVEVLDWFGRE